MFVRGDVYNVSSFPQNNISGPADTFTRELAGIGFDYRYPFILNTGSTSHVIEPVAQIVSRAGQANNALVPITDAQSLIFSDALLFDINKFSGWDQIETGTRTNFGVQYTLSSASGISVRATAGESIQVAGPNAYSLNTIYQGSGLENVLSDYVLGTYVDYKNMFRGIAQIRINEKDGSLDNQSYTLQTKLGFLQAGVSYEAIQAQPTLGFLQARQEVSGFGALKVTDEWSIFGDLRYDFEYGTFIRNSAGIQYADDCVIYSFAYQQTNVKFKTSSRIPRSCFALASRASASKPRRPRSTICHRKRRHTAKRSFVFAEFVQHALACRTTLRWCIRAKRMRCPKPVATFGKLASAYWPNSRARRMWRLRVYAPP